MAKPRVFISSTFFDLRQVRADLERFINEMGYESVRNETGAIPYGKDLKLEEYCYREISGIDILVGIIGGRFGSQSGGSEYSITQTEIKTALEQNKNVYIFIQKNVHSEYQTYLINKESKDIQYRYADDIKIYQFIEEVYSLPKNNVIHSFETAQDIISFLKEQWAGLFKDLLNENHTKKEYENIAGKVNELGAVSDTLKRYLENVLESVNKDHSSSLIESETEKLKQFQLSQELLKFDYFKHLVHSHNVDAENLIELIKKSKSITGLFNSLEKNYPTENEVRNFSCIYDFENLESLNKVRKKLNLPIFKPNKKEREKINEEPEILKFFKEAIEKKARKRFLEEE